MGNAYDSDAKLWDFHARAYDAGVGRFTSKDPVAGLATVSQTLNPYAYGVNGPLAYPDPSGEFPPALAAAAPIAGRVALAVGADYALNAAVSGTHYMVTRPEDKPFNLEDFTYTVGGEALDLTIADLKNPWTLLSPVHKFDKISDILRITDGFPPIKPGSAGGPTAGQPFPRSVKTAADAENPGKICIYCRRPGTGTQTDHAIPRSRGGDATLDNAQKACPHCNASKRDRDYPVNPPKDYQGQWSPSWWQRR